jgi:hypothetical protein
LVVSERMRSAIQSSNFANITYISFSATGGSCGLARTAKQQVNRREHRFGHPQADARW